MRAQMREFAKKLKTDFDSSLSLYSAKVSILIALFLILALLILTGRRSYISELNEGDISLVDVYAPYDFAYPGEIDETKTKALKDKVLRDFLPIYTTLINYWDGKNRILLEFFKELKGVNELKDIGDDERIGRLKKKLTDIEIENKRLTPFLHRDADVLQKTSLNILNMLSSKIIVDETTLNELAKDNKGEIIVHNKNLNVEAKIPHSDLYTKDKLKPIIEKALDSEGIEQGELRRALTNLILCIITPNLAYDRTETEARRKTLLDELPIVYNRILVKKNELIIGKGQRVTNTHLLQLSQLAKRETGYAQIAYPAGIIIFLIIFLVIGVVYLSFYQTKIFAENKNLYLISIVVLSTIFMSKLITNSPLPSYFMPIASAAMLLAILLDAGVAFLLSILLSIFAGVIAGNKFDIIAVSLISCIAGIYFIRGVRQRSQILKAGIFVGLANFSVICGIGLLSLLEPTVFLKEGTWGVASGILSAGIVMFLLPVFEYIFKITTDITLLELSDLNHPLLKKMVINAPGTYHHSLVVGNLAEAASDAIGANSLLARVGAYYHDIGKIGKAEYFSENESSSKSPYEKLTPSMSALVIQSHVRDGLELAKKYNLNKTIRDFIAQHHGTSLIYYFYQRALENIEDEEKLKEEAFRYPGPKPQAKETAIVLLADAVEASSRTLSDPTPSRIKGLVQKIINNKFIDNQLDNCDLSLKDLNKIAAAFVRILTGIFHTRVEYPEETKNKIITKGKKKTQ